MIRTGPSSLMATTLTKCMLDSGLTLISISHLLLRSLTPHPTRRVPCRSRRRCSSGAEHCLHSDSRHQGCKLGRPGVPSRVGRRNVRAAPRRRRQRRRLVCAGLEPRSLVQRRTLCVLVEGAGGPAAQPRSGLRDEPELVRQLRHHLCATPHAFLSSMPPHTRRATFRNMLRNCPLLIDA